MSPEDKREFLLELFNFLTEEDLNFLISTEEDVNTLITRVLDKNYKPLKLDVKELASVPRSATVYKNPLKYPEVFELYYNQVDIDEFRLKAARIYDEATELMKKSTENPKFSIEYVCEADRKREIAKEYDRMAAINVMRESIKNIRKKTDDIDLHRLYIREAIDFINDLYIKWSFDSISLVTGQRQKNKRLRPAIEKWFEEHGFSWQDQFAIIKGFRKK
ncbi:hypothetical protein NUSPORA_00936 [Nucleospora cyclopteri]